VKNIYLPQTAVIPDPGPAPGYLLLAQKSDLLIKIDILAKNYLQIRAMKNLH
jgi:hypothetical protein